MNSQPLLSIGLFVYNAERFIQKALDSLLGQTFGDFELIISDNASSDRTGEICREYAARDPRIRYYRNPKNMGAGWNIRRVVELATGKYFKWAAGDDMLEPEFLSQCIRALEVDPGCVLAHAKTRIIDENGNFVENYHWPMKTESTNAVTRFREMLLNDHLCFQIFGVIRMDALRSVPPQGSYVNSDGVLLSQLSLIGRFWESPEPLFISTRHSGQSTRTIPVRVKQPRFRLTKRHGTLPSPEWWDPTKTRSITFPEFRQLREYFLSIGRAPLRSGEKLRCYLLLIPWIKKHFRRMMKDLVIAADLVLFNWQVRKTASTTFQPVRSESE
jgi:glycosyltransferase involved in cell wall biosynthesis